MFSPTGYYANYKTLAVDGEGVYRESAYPCLPVVGWDSNGDPLVVDTEGRRVKALEHVPRRKWREAVLVYVHIRPVALDDEDEG